MTEFFKLLFSSDFMPHGFCYLWDPRLVWLHVIADGVIALSYYCIPIILIYFIRKNRGVTFNRIFWMFGAFILACGTSHLMEVWNVWHGSYLISGVVKAITAVVSAATVAMLVRLVPRMISLPGRIHLQEANLKLKRQIAKRAQFDAPIDAPLRRRVTGGFVAAIVATMLIGLSSWRVTVLAADDDDWVAHTYAVMDTLEFTTKHAIEAETSGRAFAVSGQDPFLAHYRMAEKAVAEDVVALRRLTSSNPQEQRQLDGLETRTAAAFAFAESIIAKRQQLQARPDPNEMLETETLVNAISAESQEIRANEMALLAERTKKSDARQRLASFLIVGGIFAGAGLWALAWLAVNREIDVSARARTQLNALNAELEQRVERRTSALQSEITERKLAEKALQESLAATESAIQDLAEQKFALDQHAIVAVTDLQGAITYVNDRFSAISQYSKEQAIGQNYHILNSGYHPKEYFQKMYDTIGKGRVWHGEIRNRAKDGSIYWVDATIVPLLDSEGKPRQYITIRTNITKRKQSEETRERLAAVVESSDDAIISKTLNGTVTAWNSGAEKLFGYSSAEALGKPMDRLLPLERANEESGILARIAGGARFTHFETVRVRKDGKRVDISATISPVRDSNGVIVGVANIARDITQRKASELEILKLNDELEEKVNVRTAQLEGVNKELEAFSYSVSHDLRAPLRHIGGFSQLLVEEFGSNLDPTAQKYVERIQAGTQKMGLLVDALLNLARLGRHALCLQPTGLNSIVAEVLVLLEPESAGRQVEWIIADLPEVECDPVLVRQIFQNLLSNALKFTRPRTHAVIEVNHQEQADGQEVFMVRDNGIGFNMKYVDKLFGVFQRLHRAEDFEGTGIGLATVQRIAQKHGGRVWAEAELEKGAAFYFTLGVEKLAESKRNRATAGGRL